MSKSFVVAAVLLWAQVGLCFRPFILHSGKNQVKLVEFYTSESCEKCDGPEKWLGALRNDKGLWKKFVPVAFHLASLNNPDGGIVDIFSKPEFTKRIKDPTDLPAIIIDGDELQWNENSKLPADKAEEVGDLSVARNKMREFEITFTPKEKFQNAKINVALLGNGISRTIIPMPTPTPTPAPSVTGPSETPTNLPAVANIAPRKLEENFVILEFISKDLHKNGNTFSDHVDLKMVRNPQVKEYSAVFWITNEETDPKPFQATGGDLKLE